jgi:hypothetical protein
MDQAEPPVRQFHAPPASLGPVVRGHLVACVQVSQHGSDFEWGCSDHRIRRRDHGLASAQRARAQRDEAGGDGGCHHRPFTPTPDCENAPHVGFRSLQCCRRLHRKGPRSGGAGATPGLRHQDQGALQRKSDRRRGSRRASWKMAMSQTARLGAARCEGAPPLVRVYAHRPLPCSQRPAGRADSRREGMGKLPRFPPWGRKEWVRGKVSASGGVSWVAYPGLALRHDAAGWSLFLSQKMRDRLAKARSRDRRRARSDRSGHKE